MAREVDVSVGSIALQCAPGRLGRLFRQQMDATVAAAWCTVYPATSKSLHGGASWASGSAILFLYNSARQTRRVGAVEYAEDTRATKSNRG